MKQLLFNLLTRLAPSEWLQEYAVKVSGIGHVGQTPKTWVEAYAIKQWNRPPNFENMALAFTDEFGRTWWEYPTDLGLPMARLEVSLQNAAMLQVLISDAQLAELREDITVTLAKGDMIAAGAVLSRFFDMRDSVRCLDILVNAVALTLARSDESPTAFDQVIHQDKINYLKASIERGDGFFFRLQEVKRLSKQLRISENHWQEWSQELAGVVANRAREREAILSLLSERE